MHIFEYPYVIITIFAVCVILLGAVGIYFAVRGVKTVKDNDEKDFVNVNKLKTGFQKSGKLRENRCIL